MQYTNSYGCLIVEKHIAKMFFFSDAVHEDSR